MGEEEMAVFAGKWDGRLEEDDAGEESEISSADEAPNELSQARLALSRRAVSSEAYGEHNVLVPYEPPIRKLDPEDEETRAWLLRLFRHHMLFCNLRREELEMIVYSMQPTVVDGQTYIIHEGDYGDCMYVVDMGVIECTIVIERKETVIKVCKKGDIFGELALLHNAPRAASVRSAEDSILWRLDRAVFAFVIADSTKR